MKNNPSDFEYVLCPGSMPDPKYQDYYDKIYSCWESVWREAFAELKVEKPLYSDSFTRQDYIGAILYKNECVALCFFRWANAEKKDFANDSYFYNWSKEHIDVLRSRGNNVIVCCYFTVHPNGRQQNLGLSGKDLLMGLVTETFLNSTADAMTGAVRINKGVNKACERWGTYLIAGDVPSGYADANVDLVGFFKDHILAQPPHELKPLVEMIWQSRVVIPRQNPEQKFSLERKFDKKAA